MKFEFAYDKLLDHRKTLEEIARKAYMLARAAVDEAEAELRKMYDDVTQARTRASRLEVAGGTQGPSLTLIAEFISGQKVRVEMQRKKIRALLDEAEAKQALLVEAAKEHKTLQKLKERRLKEFKKALKKRELKMVDEIVTTRFKRESA